MRFRSVTVSVFLIAGFRIAALLVLGVAVSTGMSFVTARIHAPQRSYVWKQHDIGFFQTFNAVWGSSPTDVFMVGDRGIIMRCDGKTCRPQVSHTFANLYAVWGTSAEDVYAVGDGGTIVHYDGSRWQSVAPRIAIDCRFLAVWSSSPASVYAAGAQGTMSLSEPGVAARIIPSGIVFHYDGTQWTRHHLDHDMGTVAALWGRSANDVYAGTSGGAILHFDGSTWKLVAQVPAQSATVMTGQYDLRALWGTSPRNLFVVGTQTIDQDDRGDGDRGNTVSFSVLLHYDGETWTREPWGGQAMPGVRPVWVNSPDDVYAVSPESALMHFDGNDWQVLSAPLPAPAYRIWASRTGEVIIISLGSILWGTPRE